MQITEWTVNDVEIIKLTGRFDAYELPGILKWFEAHPEVKYMVINLSGVGFIDSSGLSMLVKGLKRCRQNGGELHLSQLQQAVFIILELTRLDKAFKIFPDDEAAIAAFKK
jgi:anti-sigma B factor antagonist